MANLVVKGVGKMELSKTERLMLINQFEILEQTNPQDSYYREGRKILESGYKVLYSEIFDRLYEEMSVEDGKFVIDALLMYRNLLDAYENLEDKGGLDKTDIKFKGFDGNEETKHYAFTNFFINDFNRFSEFSENRYGEFNTHSQMIPKYRRMLEVWEQIAEKYERSLTLEQIKKIINA